MRIISGVVPGASRLARLQVGLSKKARQRLKWFDYYNSRGCNARLTCRHFDISPQTFYRWKGCYNPRHLRQPTYSTELVEAVLKLRETYPGRGKDKLVILLHSEGFDCSASMAGRILHKLKERGVLKEPVSNHISVRRYSRDGYTGCQTSTRGNTQALGYLTPLEFLEQYQQKRREVMCH